VYTPSTREAELLVFEHLVLAEEDGLAVYRNQTSRVDLWPWPCLESLMHVKKVKSYDGIVAHYSFRSGKVISDLGSSRIAMEREHIPSGWVSWADLK
jgi:predicted amino acid dehydrogenase